MIHSGVALNKMQDDKFSVRQERIIFQLIHQFFRIAGFEFFIFYARHFALCFLPNFPQIISLGSGRNCIELFHAAGLNSL
jgi:hypothetical protein